MSRSMDDLAESSSHWIYEQDQDCVCCSLPKWRTGWDLSFIDKQWTSSFEELGDATKNGCQNCGVILDAVSTYIAPETYLPGTKIAVEPCPEEGRLCIDIKPWQDSKDIYVELEVFHSLERIPIDSKPTFEIGHPQIMGDLDTETHSEFPALAQGLSRQTCQVVSDWIDKCVNDHNSCASVRATSLPMRVLQLSSDTVHVRENMTRRVPYACLSHCWGEKGPDLKLTSDTMLNLKEGTLISHLPKTFRDAVRVCQSLRISFLWIDALCIKQDDLQDWKETAAQMASIYENAFVTLAATYAPDSNGGLFAEDQTLQLRKHPSIYTRERSDAPHLAFVYHSLSSYTSECARQYPLLFRAWVYQERRLSQRVIHFTRHHVLWECKSCFLSEDKTIDTDWHNYIRPRDLGVPVIYREPFGYWSGDPITDWQKTVSDFQYLQLTYESDRLPAITALAERMMRTRQGKDAYVAGMWRNSLLDDLGWFRDGRAYKRPKSTLPSWSWASIQGNVTWPDLVLLPGVEVSDIRYTRIGPTIIGEVIDASIKLKGRVIELTFELEPDVEKRRTVPFRALTIPDLAPGCSSIEVLDFYTDFDLSSSSLAQGDIITALIIYRRDCVFSGLLLRRTRGKFDEYERIGIAFISHKYVLPKIKAYVFPNIKATKLEIKENDEQVEGYINSRPLQSLKIV